MEAKEQLMARGKFEVKNGEQIRLWEGRWVGNEPPMVAYLSLCNLVRVK